MFPAVDFFVVVVFFVVEEDFFPVSSFFPSDLGFVVDDVEEDLDVLPVVFAVDVEEDVFAVLVFAVDVDVVFPAFSFAFLWASAMASANV